MKWRKIQLTDIELELLKNAEKKVKKPQILKRIQCIKLKNSQWKNVALADFFMTDVHTITSWIKAYYENGINGLLEWNYSGKVSVLTQQQQRKLQERNKKKPFETAKEAKKYIKDMYGIDFHLHWVQKLLKKKLQLSYKKVILRPGKIPDETVQIEARDKYLKLIEEAKQGKFHLFFHDPCHQLHNTIAGKCWQQKGAEGTIVLNSNTGRKRVTIIGTINAITYKLWLFIKLSG